MKKLLTLLAFGIALFANQVAGQTNHKTESDAKKAAGSGITFKIPNGVMPTDWKGFKGMLMLEQRPSGIVISYPEEGESISGLKGRMAKAIAQMFVHNEKTAGEINWIDTDISSNKGDKGNGIQKLVETEKQILQVNLFEREWNGLNVVYGYFAMKDKKNNAKKDSGDFLDAEGKGSKVFEAFWKTFPKK